MSGVFSKIVSMVVPATTAPAPAPAQAGGASAALTNVPTRDQEPGRRATAGGETDLENAAGSFLGDSNPRARRRSASRELLG